ncbi:HNHc domain-containing protein [Fusarium sp. LHS14.1]|nr:HNHc domain-containing protein [Fusarium sp. LHS14.1]
MEPLHCHRSSLEGVIDFSESTWRVLSADERDKTQAVFHDIINHFEGTSTSTKDKPYDRINLVSLTYEHSPSEDPRCPFLQEFFRFVNTTVDDCINFDDETRVDEIRSGINSFADFLVDNFFLSLKASATRTPQPSPAGSSQAPSRYSALESRERVASLRRDCLIRDRHRCVISRNFYLNEADRRFENNGDDFALDDKRQLLRDQDLGSFAELEVAHILPHSLNTLTANPELNKSKATALEILDMFDKGIVHLIGGPDIDRPLNALTLRIDLHRQSGNSKIFSKLCPSPHASLTPTVLTRPNIGG